MQLGYVIYDDAVLFGSNLVTTQRFERVDDLLVQLGVDGALGQHSLSLVRVSLYAVF